MFPTAIGSYLVPTRTGSGTEYRFSARMFISSSFDRRPEYETVRVLPGNHADRADHTGRQGRQTRLVNLQRRLPGNQRIFGGIRIRTGNCPEQTGRKHP